MVSGGRSGQQISDHVALGEQLGGARVYAGPRGGVQGHALDDLRQAAADSFYRDTRHDTSVVIGDRSRAHVFNAEGKLVTSLRMRSDELERKVRKGRWAPMNAEDIAKVRAVVEAAGAQGEG